jgi:hypothetical protein
MGWVGWRLGSGVDERSGRVRMLAHGGSVSSFHM